MMSPPIILLALLLAPSQLVMVDFPGERTVEGHFHAMLQMRGDGEARGGLTLWHESPVEPGSWLLLTLVFDEARVEETADGLLIEFSGWGEVSDGRGRGRGRLLAGDEFTGQIGPWDPEEDDPIWQFHGPGVYTAGASFEASTRLLLTDGDDPPRR